MIQKGDYVVKRDDQNLQPIKLEVVGREGTMIEIVAPNGRYTYWDNSSLYCRYLGRFTLSELQS